MPVRKKILTRIEEIQEIIDNSSVCYLAMSDNNKPYVVPMNFGYQDGIFYFHGGDFGKKLAILRKNPQVSISLVSESKLHKRHEEVACSYSMLYKSVVAQGEVVFENDPHLKRKYLNIIMKQYTGKDDFEYNDPAVNNVIVFFVKVYKITAHLRMNM